MIIGLDVGGTHTDVVLLNRNGLIRKAKFETDQSDLFQTVLSAISEITEGIHLADIERAVLSTTLTTNAIIQKKTPKVGMIISAGPGIDPRYYRTNANYFTVSGSIDHRGREVAPIDETEIMRIVETLKARNISSIGVVGKFCTRNPKHEMDIFRLARPSFETVFMGHRVSGSLNFPRRIATTYINAVVHPIHRRFYQAVQQSLRKWGAPIPIHILKADGGTMNFDSSIEFPGQSILSGPAASVMGAVSFAAEADDCLVLDIGGTTTDMAILVKQKPLLEPLGIRLGSHRTLIRSLHTRSIGIGGDSYIRVRNNRIAIGPQRKGKAMAHGGCHPTPTDALFVLGHADNGDREQALKGITEIADQLGSSAGDTAQAIFDRTCEIILENITELISRVNRKPVYTVHEFMQGHRVNPKKILLLGGASRHFAKRIPEISTYQADLVPNWQVANAVGAAIARPTCEVSLYADTQQRLVGAPGEDFQQTISGNFDQAAALEIAFDLLKKKARKIGAEEKDLEMEVLESQQFNMVRGFRTIGKNIRMKVQIKPGLISEYASSLQKGVLP